MSIRSRKPKRKAYANVDQKGVGMAISERDRVAVERVKRSQKIVPILIVLMWIVGGALFAYKTSVLLSAMRPEGVESVSELFSFVSSIDTHQEEFSRFEVFLLNEKNSATGVRQNSLFW